MNLLWRLGLAFAMIASATVVTIVLWKFQLTALPRVAPFLFLVAVLASSWAGGYTAGIASVFFTACINSILTRRALDLTQVDPYRVSLLLLLSVAVSWIEAHRRHVEAELLARVEQKTAQLQAVVENLESEVQERKAGEEEIRRLNHLLELRVDERTRQLEVSNKELESFSYSVSHDLRAPLRSIDGFSRILLGTCMAKFNEEERGLFQRVLAATGRMNELIDDLLNLARVTRTAMNASLVDLSGVATRIADELHKEHPESRTEFIIQPGLNADCDSSLVDVVLHNLLENAWKFSAQSAAPRVEFGATSMTGEQVLFVKDNGAGFDPAYKEKLFTPFQRLHRQEEFPGTGIGLATVSRIVHRHGGWITAESHPGKGATFFFTLAASAVKTAGNPPGSRTLYLPEEPKPPEPRSEVPSSPSSQATAT
jgi:signal transduction histidine kinase